MQSPRRTTGPKSPLQVASPKPKPSLSLSDYLTYDRVRNNCFKILDREVYSGPIKLNNFPVSMLLECRDSGLRKTLLIFLALLIDSSKLNVTEVSQETRLPHVLGRALLVADKVQEFSRFVQEFEAWDHKQTTKAMIHETKTKSVIGLDEKPILFSIKPEENIQPSVLGLSRRDIRDVLQTKCLNLVPDPRTRIVWLMQVRKPTLTMRKEAKLDNSLNQSVSSNMRSFLAEPSFEPKKPRKSESTNIFKIKRSSQEFNSLKEHSGVIHHLKKKYTDSVEKNNSVNKSTNISVCHTPPMFSVPKIYSTLRQMKLPQAPVTPYRKTSMGIRASTNTTLSFSRLEASFSQPPVAQQRGNFLLPPQPILAELDTQNLDARVQKRGIIVRGHRPVSQFFVSTVSASPPRSESSADASVDSLRGLFGETDSETK